ncbi:FAD-binding and (Fe-S)-binding domain-containing protein [Streptomyces fradiae]|uniref:FAD-binding and (Fe-S)-binding domain-containing protein n=1 Tax=Streptomyces fradiae TaxID=1906 RepID=UPI002942E0B6|nr:FAD-binding and (Fe-S)-binding domain-containing protein [Streptomyces fradiae]WOI60479.1 FAD-binding and (Fe-S)-binding domain-containing protein [Streptomyces fradiae]
MPLLEPKPDPLRPDGHGRTPRHDRLPDLLARGTPSRLREELTAVLGREKVLSRVSDLVRYASDASPYRFVPQVVLVAEDVDDVAAILAYAHGKGRELVFRAAGTSLNGQAQGEDILVDVRRHWEGVEVLDGGARVRVRPGTTVARVNAALAPYGRVLGPDPASAAACTVGGVVANNASGMTAGTARGAYRTVASLTVVLPSGTVVDTGDPAADEVLARAEPKLCEALLDLKARLEADAALAARIRAKHRIKNTHGYRLDAFLDGATPAEILRGLMVGSQGTFGFIAEIVFDTLPLDRAVSTALLLFPSLPAAAAAVPRFTAAGALAVELMDGNTLRACVQVPGVPADWAELPRDCAALLVELRAPDAAALDALEWAAVEVLDTLGTIAPVPSVANAFTRRAGTIAGYRKARKAFVTAVGGSRPPGTTLITEDFAVPPARLAEACAALLDLQAEHGFTTAVAGHAAHGNLHFLLAFDPSSPTDVERYAAFMDAFCRMTVERFDGSLKAEHATGRNLAPYLELEWGPRATELMWRTKQAIDPHGVLAPRVVLDRDPHAHLRGLKSVPAVDPLVDACIECGFCEPVCPSRDLTTTPRQRIVLRREMTRQGHGSRVEDALVAEYGYDAVDTCAVDGSCATACPVGIDTGALVKRLRQLRHSPREERAAALAARNFAAVERAARRAVAAAHRSGGVGGERLPRAVTGALRRVVRPDLVPEWLPELPDAAPEALPATDRAGAAAVYYPACVNRVLGGPVRVAGPSLPEAVVALSARAGRPVWIPGDVHGTCCATIWTSKGYAEGAAVMARRIVEAAWGWTGGGLLPLVVDASSCALGLGREVVPYLDGRTRELHGELTVYDPLVWAADHLLPGLTVRRTVRSAVVHPTCSTERLGVGERLAALAAVCADEVVVPVDAGCCAFAGDRGLLHPELTEAATAREAAEVAARGFDAYLCANRTCEIGMEHATGRPYRSVLLELERATRP